MSRSSKWLTGVTGGASAAPLFVLFGLNFVDEFDRFAFAALTPEIRDAFDLSDAGIGAIGVVASVFVLIAALPVGILGDRFSRLKISGGAAVLWGSMTVLTGVAPTVAVLFVARLLTGIGRITNEVVHPSLLGDYYKPEHQPRIFQVHRLANPLSAVSGIVAGGIAAAFGWRWAFVVLAVPTFFLITGLARLRDPKRGESIDADLAAKVEERQGAVPYGEARRQLYSVRTLRRLWLGAFFLGMGLLSINQLLSLYFENVYGWGPVGRGFVQFLQGAGWVAGLIWGGRLATRATREGDTPRLATITGLTFLVFAGGLLLMALSPWAPLSAAFVVVGAVGVGAYQPAYLPLVGRVAPPRVRTQAYAWAVLWVGLGAFLAIPLFGLGESQGYRLALGILSVFIALAGVIGASARRYVARDVEQADNALTTALRVIEEFEGDGDRPMLVCDGVEVAYDQVQVLFGVDMEVREGEVVALLGTNGAGKSTLLKAISGLVDPIGGSVYFDGRDVTHADAVQTSKLGIVQVPGGKAVFPTVTVADHFKAGTWLYSDDDPADVQARIDEVLDRFPRLRERWDQMAGNLSGGEQQQLAVGMAFVAKPKLLIIDELSLGLAPTIVEDLLGMVRQINESGTTIILVEQSVNVALTIADRAYFMEKGEVRFSGPTEELLERGDILRSVFLEGAGTAGIGQRAKARKVARAGSAGSGNGDGPPPVLEVSALTKRFGGITAVDGVSLSLGENEILGLIGPNGAGKTTVFDLISGHLTADGGRIVLTGVDVTTMSPDRRAALGLGRSFQDARIFPSMTVAENLALGLERHIEVRDHLSALLDLPAIQESEMHVAWSVDDLVELMHLGAFRNKFVGELSTGSRRIVDLAMAIGHDPTVLILDEPSSGIAQKETEALGPLLKRIQRETTCALLVIEHDMGLINEVSDRLIALELGAVIAEGTPAEVMGDRRVIESYLGGDLDVIHRSGARGGGGTRRTKTKARKPPKASAKGASAKRASPKKKPVGAGRKAK